MSSSIDNQVHHVSVPTSASDTLEDVELLVLIREILRDNTVPEEIKQKVIRMSSIITKLLDNLRDQYAVATSLKELRTLLQEQITKIEFQHAHTLEANADLRDTIQNLEQNLEDVRGLDQNKATIILNLEQEVKNQKRDAKTRETYITTAEESISLLNAQALDAKLKIGTLQKDIRQLEFPQKNVHLNQTLPKLGNIITQTTSTRHDKHLLEENAKLVNQLQASKESIQELQNLYRTITNERTSLLNEKQELKDELDCVSKKGKRSVERLQRAKEEWQQQWKKEKDLVKSLLEELGSQNNLISNNLGKQMTLREEVEIVEQTGKRVKWLHRHSERWRRLFTKDDKEDSDWSD